MNRFVAIDVSLGDNPKVRRFARELMGDKPHAVAIAAGCLTMVLGHCRIAVPTGNISDLDDRLLEEWAHWDGKRGHFAAAFRATFATDGKLKDWEDWNGWLIDRQERERVRVQTWREKQAAYADRTRTDTHTERVRNANGNGNGTHNRTSTVLVNRQTDRQTDQPPHTPKPHKPLAAGAEKSPAADTTWLTEPAQAYERRFGAGSFPFGKAAAALKSMHRAGISPGEIATRLGNYFDARWGDRFATFVDFAEHHGQYAGPLVDDHGVQTELGRRVLEGAGRRLSA